MVLELSKHTRNVDHSEQQLYQFTPSDSKVSFVISIKLWASVTANIYSKMVETLIYKKSYFMINKLIFQAIGNFFFFNFTIVKINLQFCNLLSKLELE